MKPLVAGVIGAGAISDAYLANLTGQFKDIIFVKSIAATSIASASRKAEKYNLLPCLADDLLNDPEIEMVIILTPVGTHHALIKQALLAGKHVYTEKTIAVESSEAKELLLLAKEKGLYLGSAPDTFLGSSLQTAAHAIDEGLIGQIHSFSIAITRNNDVLTSMFPFLRLKGAGILRDYVVYYLTSLCALLGPAETTACFLSTPYPKRTCILPNARDFGQEIETPNEAIATAIIKLKNGITGTLSDNSETNLVDRADFAIYGTKGTLLIGCANNFGDPVRFIKAMPEDYAKPQEPEILPSKNTYRENCRGLGAAEMALAIRKQKPLRASGNLALHVLEILEAMERSSANNTFEKIESTFEIPERFIAL